MPPRHPAPRPLLVSSDEDLLDDLLRLVAAAGADAQVATGGPALRRAHREAPVVLLGADVLTSAAVRALPRRDALVVVAQDDLPPAAWATAVELGAERVVVLPADESWLLSRTVSALRAPVDRGWVLAVGGCCGGAGASTLATAVALAAASGGGEVLLVDTDVRGGGLDLVLGAERAEGLRWPECTGLRGRVTGSALMAAVPEVGGVHVLAASRSAPAPLPGEALAAVVAAARGGGWPVVVDLARAADPEAADVVLAEADLALLVVPGRLRAASAARLLVTPGPGAAPAPWASARLVVRPVAGGLSAAEVADVVGRPVLAELGHDRTAVPRGERGEPPLVTLRSPMGALSRVVLGELSRRPGEAW